jgi:hypothetical protein
MASLTRHERELRRRLKDSNSWPAFLNPDFAERLERTGIRAIERRSTEGDVTAIIIFHQITEQMLRVLIADAQFFVSVSVMPMRITFSDPPRQTFGQVLAMLRNGVEFKDKDRLLTLSGALNDLRNGVAHRLLHRGSLAGLRRDAHRSHRLFDRVSSIFAAAHDEFRTTFHGLPKELD